jgi:hypothetical protein
MRFEALFVEQADSLFRSRYLKCSPELNRLTACSTEGDFPQSCPALFFLLIIISVLGCLTFEKAINTKTPSVEK